MTTDSNNKVIRCGDIVKIENAFFKNDNGYWFVEQDGTNESYSGDGLTLIKIGKRGKISKAKYNLAFWPLCSFCSDREKRYESDRHNEQFATITVVGDVDNAEVIEYIKDKMETAERQVEYWENHFDNYTAPERKAAAYWKKALERLEG